MALVADTTSTAGGVATPGVAVPPAQPPSAAQRPSADRVMRRVLRLPVDGPSGTAEGARKAFQTSVMVAAVRCILMYLVFPFVLPAVGLAKGIGPAVGLVVNGAAMVCIVMSMRRFFRADHPKRWWYAALGGSMLVLLSVLAVVDVADLIG